MNDHKCKIKMQDISKFLTDIFGDSPIKIKKISEFEKDYSNLPFGTYNTLLNSFHTMPSKIFDIIDNSDKTYEDIKGLIDNSIQTDKIWLYHPSSEPDMESLFVNIKKKVFIENLIGYDNSREEFFNHLLINETFSRFLFYLSNKSQTQVYVYLGELIENKFVRIIY